MGISLVLFCFVFSAEFSVLFPMFFQPKFAPFFLKAVFFAKFEVYIGINYLFHSFFFFLLDHKNYFFKGKKKELFLSDPTAFFPISSLAGSNRGRQNSKLWKFCYRRCLPSLLRPRYRAPPLASPSR